jgi:DNA-binding NtrC family response regulator
LMLYSEVLKNAGYHVIAASTIQAMQNMTLIHTFDLCISDLNVGLSSGEMMLHTLAQLQRKHGFALLVISGVAERYANLADFFQMRRLQKPFRNRVLIETVTEILNQHDSAHA